MMRLSLRLACKLELLEADICSAVDGCNACQTPQGCLCTAWASSDVVTIGVIACYVLRSRSDAIFTCIALTCALACSFRGDPFSRPRWASRMGALSWGLDLANFEGVPVRLHGFEMENVSMLWSAFVAQIFRQVRVRSLSKTICQCPM